MQIKIFKTIIFFSLILLSCTSHASKKNVIYVYNDEGVGKQSLEQTMNTFKRFSNKRYKVETINATSVNDKKWTESAALFIMPGGADLPYTKKLNGKGNQIIKDYVKAGGSYLGICAGAYYGSGYVEFDKSGPLQVLGNRELAFFQGTAIGPAIAKFDYKNNSGARAANIRITADNLTQEINLYFNGGPYFKDPENFKNVEVLGAYQLPKKKMLPAILYIKFGKGNVILSGVHFEHDPTYFDKNDIHLAKLVSDLEKDSAGRKALITKIFELLKLQN
jgi:glutamine amidotransferase-like uncharacterized protein